MAWLQRLNQTTGQYEEVNEETGDVRPMGQQQVAQAAAPTQVAQPQRPIPAAPNVPNVPGDGPNFGAILAEGLSARRPEYRPPNVVVTNTGGLTLQSQTPAGPQAPAARSTGGSNTGAAAGSYEPIFSGQPTTPTPLPQDQPIIELLQSIQESVSQPMQYPEAPTYTADPANAQLVEIERQRQQRLDPIIQRLIGEVETQQTEHANRPRIRQFGEWLSQLAANGELRNAGAILGQMRARTAAQNHDWTAEVLRLSEAGYGLEEAIARAQAGVTSGEHAASQRTMESGYARDVGQAEADLNARNAGANVGITTAQILQESLAAASERQLAALAQLTDDPHVGPAASRQLGAETFPQDSRMAQTYGRSLANQQRLRSLAQRVSGPYNQRSDRNALRRELRRIDPTVTDEDVNQIILMLSAQPTQ